MNNATNPYGVALVPLRRCLGASLQRLMPRTCCFMTVVNSAGSMKTMKEKELTAVRRLRLLAAVLPSAMPGLVA